MLLHVLMLVVGLMLLYYGAEWLVRGASAMGLRLGMAPLLIGLTVVAFGTSMPELLVSLRAGFDGKGDIAIGNVVGSNIANIALILGVAALIRPLKVQAQVVRREVPLGIGAAVLLCVLLYNGVLGRIEGIALFIALVIYLVISFRDAKAEDNPEVAAEYAEAVEPAIRPTWQYILLCVVGLAVLVAGAHLLVDGSVDIAAALGVPEAVIALTIIAVGTSLPELATSAVASWRNEGDIAVGNALGSNLFNILAVLGLSAFIIPLSQGNVSWVDLGVMVAVAAALLPMVRLGFRLSRLEGVLLLSLYVGYITWLVASLD